MMPLPFSIAWIGAAIAIAQIAILAWHLRRRYPSLPKRMPTGLRFDGRPGPTGPKALLWLGPAIIATVTAILVVFLLARPLPEEARLTTFLVFVVIAEVAWLCEWVTDRLVELARGMTHRIAPTRLLLAILPMLATIGIALVVAITQTL